MRFEESLRVPATREAAWGFFWQTERVAGCIPGCTSAEEVEGGKSYRAVFEDSIGPYKVRFEMDIVVVEAREPERIRLQASGRDTRLGARQQVTLTVDLSDAATGETAIDVLADVEILGKVATLGQFAIKRKVKSVVEGFAQCVSRELAGA